MAKQQAEIGQNRLQYISFTLGDEYFGINVLQIQEILRDTDIAPVPGAPDYIIGIINLRGEIVSVIDARTRFCMPNCENTPMTRIIVVDVQQKILGILVDIDRQHPLPAQNPS